VQLCDFGLSGVLPTAPAMDGAGGVQGTPAYMAPEVALGRPIALPQAIDTYGVGVVLHDLAHVGVSEVTWGARAATPRADAGCSETTAGAGWGPLQVLFARVAAGFAVDIAPQCPPPLAALLRRCLAVEPAARPDGSALREELVRMRAAWTS
jgi:serine/threonine protein kinase